MCIAQKCGRNKQPISRFHIDAAISARHSTAVAQHPALSVSRQRAKLTVAVNGQAKKCATMSTLENEVTFRKQAEVNQNLEAQFRSSSTDFILLTDHRTSKYKSLEQLEAAKQENEPAPSCCTNYLRNTFRMKTLKKRLPIINWLPKYNKADAFGDIIAGFTVGLTVIPQGLAYSGVVGLPAESGLYGSFLGCFVYVLLGTCKDNTIGSTAVASLMTFQFARGSWARSVLLTFLTGVIEILMAIFKLGSLVEFVSGPVSAGFTSAVSLIVLTSQMKYILGVNGDGASFLESWINMISDIKNIRIWDSCLGFGCLALLLIIRSLSRFRVGPKEKSERSQLQRVINEVIKFLGVTRNASVVIGATLIAMYLEGNGSNPFVLTGYIPPGLPTISLPKFSIEAQTGNATAGIPAVPGESFFEMVHTLGYGLIIVPIIALLENVSVCKAFAKDRQIDISQELFATGVANIANSMVSGYRSNGGLARSAVNNASGCRTNMSNLYIGMIVVMSISYLTEYFYFIPKAVLASIIISAVVFQMQYQCIMPMWRSKRSDLVPGVFAFITCLVLPLEIGITVAIGANQLYILYHSARPKVTLEQLETEQGIKFVKITPDRCLIFPSVEFVRNMVLKSGSKTTLPVVIDCTYIYAADFTAAKVISSMVDDFRRRQQKIIFFNLKPSVVSIFEGLKTKLVLCYNMHALNQELLPNSTENLSRSVDSLDIEGGTSECVSMTSTSTLSLAK
ncbi:sodium-independent sulfate anion transporter isoform X1 [Drosophila nasuta]|uniref:sodium-independent sulfate anion transporter isoform X1 n=1 Tax=Drosophila nasuta TaxID=42062 RepID=UPI00295E2233|nr:sodium-independent sulfate anion transporter isoform X1 [Drosophila nasuta]